MCTIYKKLELAQIIQHSVKVLLPILMKKTLFLLLLFRISKILHKIWEQRVRKFVSQRHLWPTLKMKIAYLNTKQVHILIDCLHFVCLQILFTFFSDKPLLPKEYFQGFDIQTSELNDEHQGGENIGFQKSCKIIFLIFGELSQILIWFLKKYFLNDLTYTKLF